MKNKKKKITFSLLIRIFVTFTLILFATLLISLDIYKANKNFKESVHQIKKNYLAKQKALLKSNVLAIVKFIEKEEENVQNIAKNKIKDKTYQAFQIAVNIYNSLKYDKSKKEIMKIIVNTLRTLTYQNGDGYFFITKLDGTAMLFPATPQIEGRNLLKILDKNGKIVVQNMIKIAREKGEGFYFYYWRKPNIRGKTFQKISFIKYFKPLNCYIGTGVYLDDVENDLFTFLQKFLNIYRFGKDRNNYIFVLKLLNINGGKNFAIMLANPNRPDLIGKYISDDFKDAKGKEFRKEFLKGLRKRGECFVSYWYKKFNNKNPSPKISFFKLTKDKKYIVASGVYLDDINKKISLLKSQLEKRKHKNIITTFTITIIILIIIIFIFKIFDNYMQKEFEDFILKLKKSIEENKVLDKNEIKFLEFYLFNKYIGKILEDKLNLLSKLQSSEKDYKALFEKSGIAMLISINKKYIDCNNNAVKLLGYNDKKELLNEVGSFSPKYQPNGELSVKKARELIDYIEKTGQTKTIQWLLQRKDGSTFWALINFSLIPYKNQKAVLVTCIDIEQLKNLENNLIKEKEQLTVTLLSIGDGVIATDINKKIQLMNNVAEKLTGYKFEEAKGKSIEEVFYIVNENSGEKVPNPIDNVIKLGKMVKLSNHTVLISKNGKEYNISDSAAPIRNKEGKIIGTILVFRDETEKVKMRNEILKAEKLKSISILAGGIAHDFNNLLTGIYGNLELASLNANEKSKKYINISLNSLDKAKALTSQLLTFAKGGEPIIGTVEIESLVKQVTDFNVSGSNVKVIYNFDENIWKIKADKGQISQVIANLIINAKQAMPEGGTIYVEIRNKHFKEKDEKTNLKGNYVMIRIKDEGEGIPDSLINKIFDPYFTTKKNGSGLGLSIIYSIIKKHDGEIKVESQLGKGTAFTVFIPAKVDAEILKEKEKPFEISQLKGKRVLIMDDNEEIRNLGKEILENFGCIVEIANNGEEAIEKYKLNKFDLVIMDLTIRGGMGGEDAIKEILKIDSNAKVIVSSGYYSNPIVANYKKYGFVGALLKPFKIEDLKNVIQECFK